jgi:hypothetical protein
MFPLRTGSVYNRFHCTNPFRLFREITAVTFEVLIAVQMYG